MANLRFRIVRKIRVRCAAWSLWANANDAQFSSASVWKSDKRSTHILTVCLSQYRFSVVGLLIVLFFKNVCFTLWFILLQNLNKKQSNVLIQSKHFSYVIQYAIYLATFLRCMIMNYDSIYFIFPVWAHFARVLVVCVTIWNVVAAIYNN